MQYHELRNYGFNLIIKDYAKFPRYLPLPCYMDHGWNTDNQPLNSDLKTDKPLMMVFSKRNAKAWKKKSDIPVVIMGSPFVHYKNTHKIKQKPDAKGAVVFPGHSTYYIKSQFQVEDYCHVLKKLPKEFQPVTICLFWLDFIDQKTNIYRKMGFKVVSAGPKFTNSLEFVKNFYNILSNHKYATSNDIGSYTFYAIDFGLPFFLTGDRPILFNKGCRDINIGERASIHDYKYGKKAINLFSTGPIKTISQAQSKYVTKEMGINDCLSPKQMNKLLWKYFNGNNYWIRASFPYFIIFILLKIIVDGPWGKYILMWRIKRGKKITE